MYSNSAGIKLETALQMYEDKIEHLSSYAHDCKTGQFTSWKERERLRISKHEKCACKDRKTIVFHYQICKFVTFLFSSSSWLLKLPNSPFAVAESQIDRLWMYHLNVSFLLLSFFRDFFSHG